MFGDELWKLTKQFLGSVGASLSGMTVVLYAFGFLSKRAHFTMLGISGAPTETVEYLKEGGTFFINSVTSLLAAVLHGVESIPWLAAGVLLAAGVALRYALRGRWHRVRGRVAEAAVPVRRRAGRALDARYLLLVLAVVMGFALLPRFVEKIEWHQGLLFYPVPEHKDPRPLLAILERVQASPRPDPERVQAITEMVRVAEDWQAAGTVRLILEDRAAPLRIAYGYLVLWLVAFGVLLVFLVGAVGPDVRPPSDASAEATPPRATGSPAPGAVEHARAGAVDFFSLQRAGLTFVAGLLLAAQLLLLPTVHGFTVRSNRFPMCQVDRLGDAGTASPVVALLSETTASVLLYDRQIRQVEILSKDAVGSIRIVGSGFVFDDDPYRRMDPLPNGVSNE